MNLTRSLYRAARASATIGAARRGPAALGRLEARRAVYRPTYRLLRAILRKVGL